MHLRWTTAAMAAFGVLVGHGLAYAAPEHADHPNTHAHQYLDTAFVFAAPYAALALFLLIRAEVRRIRRLRLGGLLAVQVVLFVLQESIERRAVGLPVVTLLTDSALWLGLGAQVLVAVIAVLTVRSAARSLRHWSRGQSHPPAPLPQIRAAVPAVVDGAPTREVCDRASARAPPPLSHFQTVRPLRRDHAFLRIPSPASGRGARSRCRPHRLLRDGDCRHW